MEQWKTSNSQSHTEEKRRKLEVSRFQILNYTTKTGIKTLCNGHKNRYTDQKVRIESLELNSSTYSQLIFDNRAKNPQWGEDSLCNKWCWIKLGDMCRTMKMDSHLTPLTKIDAKQIKDINMRPDSMQLLEEYAGKSLINIGLGNDFLLCGAKTKYIHTHTHKQESTNQTTSNWKAFAQQNS